MSETMALDSWPWDPQELAKGESIRETWPSCMTALACLRYHCSVGASLCREWAPACTPSWQMQARTRARSSHAGNKLEHSWRPSQRRAWSRTSSWDCRAGIENSTCCLLAAECIARAGLPVAEDRNCTGLARVQMLWHCWIHRMQTVMGKWVGCPFRWGVDVQVGVEGIALDALAFVDAWRT